MTRLFIIFLFVLSIGNCSGQSDSPSEALSTESTENSLIRIVLASEVEWEALNPARGDMSPRAGTLWGDRNGEIPNVNRYENKFADGISTPSKHT